MFNHGFDRPIDDYFWMLEKYESYRDGKGVSAIGRGENIVGATIVNRNFSLHKNVHLRGKKVIGKFQIQPDGRITPVLDMSWEERDAHYGQEYNILNHPLEKILRRH
jgi:hypothetical protein